MLSAFAQWVLRATLDEYKSSHVHKKPLSNALGRGVWGRGRLKQYRALLHPPLKGHDALRPIAELPDAIPHILHPAPPDYARPLPRQWGLPFSRISTEGALCGSFANSRAFSIARCKLPSSSTSPRSKACSPVQDASRHRSHRSRRSSYPRLSATRSRNNS